MITSSFRNNIFEMLKSKHTSREDYKIETADSIGKEVIITYRYMDNFKYEVNLRSSEMRATFTPGDILKTENGLFKNKHDLLNSINDWVGYIDNEFDRMPEFRAINEQDQKIKEIEEMLSGFEDEPFKSSEIEELNRRLDSLQEDLESKVNEDIERDKERDKIIKELRGEINTLKMQSYTLSKKNWLLSFSTKMYVFTQKHPKIAKLAGVAILLSIPEGIKENIPEEFSKLLLPEYQKPEEKQEDS